MNWIREIEFEDLLNNDMALVYQECGIDVALSLWERLSGLNIYVSEKSLFEIKKRYIRTFHDPADQRGSIKRLAAKLKCSEKFVAQALATTEEKDDRQGKLI